MPTAAGTLLQFIPEEKILRLFRSLIESLQPNDESGLDLVASLVERDASSLTQNSFLDAFDQILRTWDTQHVVSVSLRHPKMGANILKQATEYVAQDESSEAGWDGNIVSKYIQLSASVVSHLPVGDSHSKLFQACLGHLSSNNADIRSGARNLIFEILSASSRKSGPDIVLLQQVNIWQTIQRLISSGSKAQMLLGYSLWLRWLLCVDRALQEDLVSDDYWRRILGGLRHGDTERRKLCLNILKLSVATDASAVPDDVRKQYDRYCTVFETIVLARYINQILECEPDLDLLATDARIPAKWLYALLASALDRTMQDSNRKFIGNWFMRSNLEPTPEFLTFVKDSFLPWATQGTLFVSTLHREASTYHCTHGDRLAAFVRGTLDRGSHPGRLSEVVVDAMMQKRSTLFAHATVYLLSGLGDTVQSKQIERCTEMFRLPEVARDFVASKVASTAFSKQYKVPASRKEQLDLEAVETCRTLDASEATLQAIWDTLEHLEYPRRLLMYIPGILLHPSLIRQATENTQLAADIETKLNTLQRMTETKPYLFSPLLSDLRSTAISCHDVLDVINFQDLIIRVAETPPELTVDLMLEEATTHLTPHSYEHYFGQKPSYGFAAYVDTISRLHAHQNLVKVILRQVLERWKDQPPPIPSVSVWKTTLQLQVLLLCFEQYIPASPDDVLPLLEDLYHVLAVEHLPRYRYLLEWIIIRLLLRYNLRNTLLTRLGTKDHHSNSKHLASLMKIGTTVVCHESSGEEFASRIATILVPLAASSKVVIRHEAQWQVPELMGHARAKRWSSITGNPAFAALDEYIRSLERFHDPPAERLVGKFDPSTDHTLTHLVEGRWFELDATGAPLTSRDEFVRLYERGIPDDAPLSCMTLGPAIDRPPPPGPTESEQTAAASRTASDPQPRHGAVALQTKGTAYLARNLTSSEDPAQRLNNLIVVGSLVDNPYNLGGLSRVSEVFGASALTLQNRNVLSNKDFTSVSVSSHLHFPIIHLSAAGIPTFLAEKKADGFTVVGIEQTDRSVMLGTEGASLPEKAVLVVGSEKEGIPAVVLTECDLLVEIPQIGVTRSLNVQTAVSVVLYEHARQHGKAIQR